jgi:hypothetical protein
LSGALVHSLSLGWACILAALAEGLHIPNRGIGGRRPDFKLNHFRGCRGNIFEDKHFGCRVGHILPINFVIACYCSWNSGGLNRDKSEAGGQLEISLDYFCLGYRCRADAVKGEITVLVQVLLAAFVFGLFTFGLAHFAEM